MSTKRLIKKKEFVRLARTDYFMAVAELTAERSTCSRAQVGCVLVDAKTNRIAAIGYNGALKGAPHCLEEGCLIVDDHCVRTIHAEQNAVMNIERKYAELICYTTHQPCINCFKLLVASNVKTIYYIHPYEDEGRDKVHQELPVDEKFAKATYDAIYYRQVSTIQMKKWGSK